MKHLIFLCVFVCAVSGLKAQYTYTIKADSVKLTNCDSSELIIENHTQNVPGFLFNTGNGRTIFKRGAQKLGNGGYLIGTDTVQTSPNAWVQGGNSFGTTGILGTLDNNPLDFYTVDTARVRISNLGNLLVGTTWDPGIYKLNVGGGAAILGDILQASNFNTSLGNGLLFTRYSHPWIFAQETIEYHSNYAGDQHLFSNSIGGAFTGNLVTMDPGPYPQLLDNQLTLKVLGKYGTIGLNVNMLGYTGIGVLAPTAQLHTTGTVRFAGLTADSSQTRVLVSDANGNLFYRSASSLAVNETIRSSLAVNGPITAQKLTLSVHDWPDYVFDSAYQLLSLPNLEKYIQQHNHLPGIPAASVVEEKGTEVGETQAALLKKIEELTLYTIEQDKKLEKQRQITDTLIREIRQLKELIQTER